MVLPVGRLMIYCRRLLIITMFIATIFACSDNDLMSDTKINNIYVENKELFSNLAGLCMSKSFIRRVSTKNIRSSDTIVPAIENDKELIYKEIRRILIQIKAISLECTRDWSTQEKKLVSVVFLFSSEGLLIGGSNKGIRYFPNLSNYLKDKVNNGELKPTEDEGWFVYHYKS